MSSFNRRHFLRMSAASVSSLVLPPFDRPACAADQPRYRTPSTIDRFIDPLPIPARAQPHSASSQWHYRVRMQEFRKQLHSQLPPTTVWGYEGQCPGPTFEAVRGQPVVVEWKNELPPQHLLPVDRSIPGATCANRASSSRHAY